MQPTAKLFEAEPYTAAFAATVLACEPAGDGFSIMLDQTAFYPEGGGQPCDTGTLGGVAVTEVHTADGIITHRTAASLPVGSKVEGLIDWPARLDHMQQHTGEHILSGTLHRLFGAENVGFHIGVDVVRMDCDLPLTAAQLAEAERAANAAVRADTPVRADYPEPEALAALTYRSKKALEGPVRIVEAGGDICACCGTHLARTGEVGLIKILSAQNYKGGTRLAVACGSRAFEAVAAAYADAEAAGKLLSAGPGRLAEPVARLQAASGADKARFSALQTALAEALAATATPGKPTALLIAGADNDGLRRMATALSAKTGAPALVCAAGGQGTAYALAHPTDARPLCKALNEKFAGRGGGKPNFCQGSVTETDFAVLEKEFITQTQE